MNSFLIVRLGSLGDIVHGIPVAAALRQEFPNSRIDWMVDPRYVELLNLVNGIDRRIPVDPRAIKHGPGRVRFRETLRELRETDYDAVIDLQGLLKSAMLARSVRGRRTIGFPRKHLREPLARFDYSRAIAGDAIPGSAGSRLRRAAETNGRYHAPVVAFPGVDSQGICSS